MSSTDEKPAAQPAAEAPAETLKSEAAAAPSSEPPAQSADAPKESETPAAPAAETKQEPEPAATANGNAPAAEKQPAADEKPAAPQVHDGPIPWPVVDENHPLSKLLAELPAILKDADYNGVYGITLDPAEPAYTKLILQKFLRANANDLAKAKQQLLSTLKWRKDFQPLKAKEETFSKERFGGLGYVTFAEGVPGSVTEKDVVTYNVYGAVKDKKATFEDLQGFIRWRVALAELGVEKINLQSATKPIPDFGKGPDPYQGIQVHDYLNVSFLRMDPAVKATSKETIKVMADYYPETLSRKFFVNVPVIMGWIYAAMKVFVNKETQKKFSMLSYGNQLAKELGPGVPVEYGGKGPELASAGQELSLKETKAETKPETKPETNGEASKAAEPAKEVKKENEAPKEAAKEEIAIEAPKEEAKQEGAKEEVKAETAA